MEELTKVENTEELTDIADNNETVVCPMETEPSLTKQVVTNGLILGGTALVGSVVLKVGNAAISKAVKGVKKGWTALREKMKARKEAKAEEKAEES